MKNIMEKLIEQLKEKPIPKKHEDVVLNFAQSNDPSMIEDDDIQEVDLESLLEKNPDFHIYDHTKNKDDFDEDLFMREINEIRKVIQNVPKITNKDSMLKEERIDELIPTNKSTAPIKRRRKTNIDKPAVTEITSFEIGDEIKQRLPKQKDIVLIKKPSYYMSNREVFLNFANTLFSDYRKEIINTGSRVQCDKTTKNVVTTNKDGVAIQSKDFSLLTHQKIILDYLNIYTPYRGLLLYHGLGSGKTCSSIAVSESFLSAASSIAFAEGLVQSKKVIVMTPASLRVNYFEELKKCGNPIYKKKQFWEFIPLSDENTKDQLSHILQLPVNYIDSAKGAWMVDITKPSNYEQLSPIQKQDLDKQLNEMIHYKYQFINYNGLQKKHVNQLTKNNTINPFDNKVVIIDEAHNFISRIVNKIGKSKDITQHTSTLLYHNLMKANNAKIIMLSGTPIINYPNEIAILYNILRGYIKTFHIPIKTGQRKYTEEQFKKIFTKHKIVDYLEYKSGILYITRTPFGFVNKFYGLAYKGFRYNNTEELNDSAFIKSIIDLLEKNGIVPRKEDVKIANSKTLPDKLEDFRELFFNEVTGNMKNENLFKKRILGLTSYFKSASEGLMPQYDHLKDTHIVRINMSDYQFSKYQEIRMIERDDEKKNRTKKMMKKPTEDIYEEVKSTYRVFSRAFCNFVFPDPPGRPMPSGSLEDSVNNMVDEEALDGVSDTDIEPIVPVDNDGNPMDAAYDNKAYNIRIKMALDTIKQQSSKYLVGENLKVFSPKFAEVLDNIDDMKGLHLLYSQFRTIEGIGVFSMVLEANGYTQFKMKKNSKQQWVLNTSVENIKNGKTFALYTGTETAEEKEMIRHVFNGTWEYLPLSLTEQLKSIHENNINGEIIKLFMITSSGAEGISLMNTKYIHIMEPYWHPVRSQQVIGRARRICSHIDLPENERKIKVFYYLMQFSDEQIDKKMNLDIRNNDVSRINKTNLRPMTSDETLYETSMRKENLSQQILKNIKEASIDCAVHSTSSSGEALECYSFGNNVDSNVFSYKPNIMDDSKDSKNKKLNEVEEKWNAKRVNINGIDYALRVDKHGKDTDLIYDIDNYLQALANPNINIRLEGKLIEKDGKKYIDTEVM